jgi:hypothetical protein
LHKQARILGALKAFAVAVVVHSAVCEYARAEEQRSAAGAGADRVTAQARVKISVTVTRLMALQLGSGNGTLDMRLSSDGPRVPPAGAPEPSGAGTQAGVFAWTNAVRGSIRCSVGDQNAILYQGRCSGYALGLAPVPASNASHQPLALIYTVAGI